MTATTATAPENGTSASNAKLNPVQKLAELMASVSMGKSTDGSGGKVADSASDAAHGDTSPVSAEFTESVATLNEIAGIILGVGRDSVGDLLLHPGRATLGVYYLAKKHQMERAADNIDGSHVGDAELVASLIRLVDISDATYPDRYPILVKQEGLLAEEDILFTNNDPHKLQPAFLIALDRPNKQVLLVIRGTHDFHDILTDLCGCATPMPGGGHVHWGMWHATQWLLRCHLTKVLDALHQNPGFNLMLIGHSMGAAVAALTALALDRDPQLASQLPSGVKVKCVGVATAACMSSDLAAACASYVTSLVMRYDLVPRFSTTSVQQLKSELLAVPYRELLAEDLMQYQPFCNAVSTVSSTAAKVAASPQVAAVVSTSQALASKVASTQQFQAAQKAAVGAAGALAARIDGALASPGDGAGQRGVGALGGVLHHAPVRGALGLVSHALKTAAGVAHPAGDGPQDNAVAEAAADAAAGAAVAVAGGAAMAAAGGAAAAAALERSLVPGGEMSAEDEAAEDEAEEAVKAAAAAGQLSDVSLYAPGRLLYLEPHDHSVAEEQQRFSLVDGKSDQRFQRIVLRSSCLADHFPVAYKAALQDVLAQVADTAASAAGSTKDALPPVL